MEKYRGIIFVLALAAIVSGAALPCLAADEKKDKKDLFAEGERRGPRPGRGRFELTDEEKDLIHYREKRHGVEGCQHGRGRRYFQRKKSWNNISKIQLSA